MLLSSQGTAGALRQGHNSPLQLTKPPARPAPLRQLCVTGTGSLFHTSQTCFCRPCLGLSASSAISVAHSNFGGVHLHLGSQLQCSALAPSNAAVAPVSCRSTCCAPRNSRRRSLGGLITSANKADKADSGVVLVQEAAEKVTEELRSGPLGLSGLQHRKQLCDSGLPDTEMCELDDPSPNFSVMSEAVSRGKWLFGLLILQSTSSFVLDSYQELLRDHLVVTLFLTMLVGAGGNAGNQSAIKIIRGMATGSIAATWPSARNVLLEQASVGFLLGSGLSLAGFVRVFVTNGNLLNASAISVSLFAIVMTSVVLGTGLPFALTKLGVDPANAGTSIQVLMDILGVGITCFTCNLVLVQLASGLGLA